jgi:hypothetical protein
MSQVTTTTTKAFINELHYQNVYTDDGEFVEVVITDATMKDKIGGLVLYDGTTGAAYRSLSVPEATPFTGGGGANNNNNTTSSVVSYLVWDMKEDILDVGPHGMALHDTAGVVLEFISYGGGSFMAVDGVAKGMISLDIGYSQNKDSSKENSLQRIGVGAAGTISDGRWVLAPRTRGAANVLQTFGNNCSTVRTRDGPAGNIHLILH